MESFSDDEKTTVAAEGSTTSPESGYGSKGSSSGSSGQPLFPNRKPHRNRSPMNQRGVVFVCGLPRGFDEKGLEKFLDQFGTITRLNVKRSKKTGESRGFAFVEFELKEVARIVADTLNGYIMFGKTLKSELLPPEDVKASTFRRNKTSKAERRDRIIKKDFLKGDEKSANAIVRQVGKDLKLKLKLKEMGVDFTPESIMPKLSKSVIERVEELEEIAREEAVQKKREWRQNFNKERRQKAMQKARRR